MPLADTDIVQSNSGSATTQNFTVSLLAGTTAGNTVILVATTQASHGVDIVAPSGFVSDSPTSGQGGNTKLFAFRRSDVPAAESSWSVSTSGASGPMCRWTCYEVQGLDATAPVDVKLSGSTTSTTSGTTASTGTLATSTTYDGWVLAAHACYDSGSATAPTFSGHTNGLVERDEGGVTDGSVSIGLSVSGKFVQALGAFESTATCSITMTATNNGVAFILVYAAQGAKRAADIKHFWGFKVGAGAVGLATGNAGNRYFETIVGSPAITADGLQLSSTAAAENVTGPGITPTNPSLGVAAAVARIKLRFDSALPGADTELARIDAASTGDVALRYVSSSQKLGVKIGTGSEVLSDATVAADTMYAVELRLIGTTTAYTLDWQVDYGAGLVAQTQATFTASAALGTWTPTLGWTAAATATVTFAYALFSIVAGHHPLGEHTIVLLGPDPAGTPTVSGTSSSFRRFTSNGGTIDGAFDAAAIRDAVDDWPPTIGASADGLAVITAHASDYIEIPLATYDAAGTGSIRAARVVLCMWAASVTAATCKVAGWDGSASATLHAEADPAADNSTTDPAWICKMWKPTGGWTQAKLDAAAIRVGAADATPDIGPHAAGMEVCVQVAISGEVIGEAGEVTTTAALDPLSSGVLGLTTTTPPHRPVTLHYTKDGTPVDVVIPADTVDTRVLDAADIAGVTDIGVENEAS